MILLQKCSVCEFYKGQQIYALTMFVKRELCFDVRHFSNTLGLLLLKVPLYSLAAD